MSTNRWRPFTVVFVLVLGLGILTSGLAAVPRRENTVQNCEQQKTNRKLVRRSYSIEELIEAANDSLSPDNLKRVILHSVQPISWKEKGGRATLEYDAEKQMLIIRQTPAAHRQIACVLEALTALHQLSTSRSANGSRGSKDKESAELKRLASDEKKEVKVVLLPLMIEKPSKEIIRADYILACMLAEEIGKLSKENKEKVTIVSPDLIEEYKKKCSNLRSVDLMKVGHDFKADYVIYFEINKLSLYEPGASQQLYRGQTEILVSVKDMKHPEDMPQRVFNDRYPSEAGGALDTFELSPIAFRDNFLRHVSQRLAFYFVDHKERARQMIRYE